MTRNPFGMAGLYDHWKDENGKEINYLYAYYDRSQIEFMKGAA